MPKLSIKIPKDKLDVFKEGTKVEIKIVDLSTSPYKTTKVTSEKSSNKYFGSLKLLVVTVPLDSCDWIESAGDLQSRTLMVVIMAKSGETTHSLVRHFHFGWFSEQSMTKVYLEKAKHFEFTNSVK